MPYFKHESAFVDEGSVIGDGTKIWHFCHVQPGAKLGRGYVLGQNANSVIASVQVRLYSATGQQLTQATTDVQGRYIFSPLLAGTYFAIDTNTLGGTGQLYSGRACSACDPASGSPFTVAAGSTTSSINFFVGPPPTLSIDEVTVTEGNSGTTTAQLTVTLSATSSSTVTASFATANGTATAGSDYVTQTGNLSFTAGQTSKKISVTVKGDTTVSGSSS